MFDVLLVSSELVLKKVWIVVVMKIVIYEFVMIVQSGVVLYGLESYLQGKVVIFGGGYLLWCDGQLIVGFGISGGSVEQDMVIVQVVMVVINVRIY